MLLNDYSSLKAALLLQQVNPTASAAGVGGQRRGHLVTLTIHPDDCELGSYPAGGRKSNVSIALNTWWLDDDDNEDEGGGRGPAGADAVIRHTDAFPWTRAGGRGLWKLRDVVIWPSGIVDLEETLVLRLPPGSAAAADDDALDDDDDDDVVVVLEVFRHKCAMGRGAIFHEGYPEDYKTIPLFTYEDLRKELLAGRWVAGQADLSQCTDDVLMGPSSWGNNNYDNGNEYGVKVQVMGFDFADHSLVADLDLIAAGADAMTAEAAGILVAVDHLPRFGDRIEFLFRKSTAGDNTDGDPDPDLVGGLVDVTLIVVHHQQQQQQQQHRQHPSSAASGAVGTGMTTTMTLTCSLSRDFKLYAQRYLGPEEDHEHHHQQLMMQMVAKASSSSSAAMTKHQQMSPAVGDDAVPSAADGDAYLSSSAVFRSSPIVIDSIRSQHSISSIHLQRDYQLVDSWEALRAAWLDGGVFEARLSTPMLTRKCSPLFHPNDDDEDDDDHIISVNVVADDEGDEGKMATIVRAHYLSDHDFIGIAAVNDNNMRRGGGASSSMSSLPAGADGNPTRTTKQHDYFLVISKNDGPTNNTRSQIIVEISSQQQQQSPRHQQLLPSSSSSFLATSPWSVLSMEASPLLVLDCGYLEEPNNAGLTLYRKLSPNN